MWWSWRAWTDMQELSATEREPMTTCMNFYPCCSFQCYFDTYCVCFLGSGNWLHLRLYLLLHMTTLKYVLSLITPVEGSGQDIHCESHMIQEQERKVWASLGFIFIYLIVLVCRKFCACTLQGGPGVRGAKGHRGDPGPKVLCTALYGCQMHRLLVYLCCM